MSQLPLICLVNDDGIEAPGIHALAEAAAGLAELHVVAPASEQSAVGHAITVRDPVRAHPWDFKTSKGSIAAHAVTGTPADCVKIAVDTLLPRRPDLILSGINHGANTAVNVLYSGTVSAATEAHILRIPAIAFSLCDFHTTDFSASTLIARGILDRVLEQGARHPMLLNVNIPFLPYEDIKGVRLTRLADSRWVESFAERRDPLNRPYYWLTGRFENLDSGQDTDLAAIESGYVSVTPLQIDLTNYHQFDALSYLGDRVAK
ncbi:MAG: 5'/3'-nucleotidase SurE [Bacteroidetes bacterium]|jgi:5'-nucleotidase|nr:5'/3'-nucleotidase SurE [Bacteroidota bacterium]